MDDRVRKSSMPENVDNSVGGRPSVPDRDERFYTRDKIFISYSHKDQEVFRQLKRMLATRYTYWKSTRVG